MLIERLLKESIKTELTHTNKVVVLYGARQVGKTTLIRDVLRDFPGKLLEINGDNTPFTDILSSRDLGRLKGMVEGYDLLFVDEAQRIPDIGINFKIMHDQLPDLKIIATGSSSLDLANRVKEPLTGRNKSTQRKTDTPKRPFGTPGSGRAGSRPGLWRRRSALSRH